MQVEELLERSRRHAALLRQKAAERPVMRDLSHVAVPAAPPSFTPAARRAPARHQTRRIVRKVLPVKPTAGRQSPSEPAPALVLVPELPTTAAIFRQRMAGWLGQKRWLLAAGFLLALGLVCWREGGGWRRARGSAMPSAVWKQGTAEGWYQQAQQRAADGDFRLALGTIKYALALEPDEARFLKFEGDMHQSLFQFPEAEMAYAQALWIDAHDRETRASLALSRRINRYRQNPAAHLSTLYGLHRVMLAQDRVSEAVAISQRLHADHALQQLTWQAALDQSSLRGKVTVAADGTMEVDLSHGGNVRPDLTPLARFPLSRLNLANSGVDDLDALRGLRLERLDVSGTPVHDLAPLGDMPLTTLNLARTGVVEISRLVRCPLRELDLSHTPVADLTPLANSRLHLLRLAGTPVSDLRPLAALPLAELDLAGTRVADLRPLADLGLRRLNVEGTGVSDLTPLRGCALGELRLAGTPVANLWPLAGMPLNTLTLAACPRVTDLRPLAACPGLEHLTLPPHPATLAPLGKLPQLRFVTAPDGQTLDVRAR